jgi:hypothetical protein
MDSVLASLTRRLKERGLWDNALVIVTSDHGEEFREHGNWDHAINLYPEKLIVPLLIKLPGQRHGGLRVEGPASHVDLVPTVLSVVGIRGPDYLVGRDLLEQAPSTGRTGREQHLAEFWGARCLDPETGEFRIERLHRSLISEGRQLIWVSSPEADAGPGQVELFDLRRDPLAQDDLGGKQPQERDRRLSALRRYYDGAGYTLAANGGGQSTTLTGLISVDGTVQTVDEEGLEAGDSVSVEEGGRRLRFELTVGEGDDDVIRLRTEPDGTALEVAEFRADGEPRADLLRVGPKGLRVPALPLLIETGPGPVDGAMAGVRRYRPGHGPALHLWRLGKGRARAGRAPVTDGEALQHLKDLGYL